MYYVLDTLSRVKTCLLQPSELFNKLIILLTKLTVPIPRYKNECSWVAAAGVGRAPHRGCTLRASQSSRSGPRRSPAARRRRGRRSCARANLPARFFGSLGSQALPSCIPFPDFCASHFNWMREQKGSQTPSRHQKRCESATVMTLHTVLAAEMSDTLCLPTFITVKMGLRGLGQLPMRATA